MKMKINKKIFNSKESYCGIDFVGNEFFCVNQKFINEADFLNAAGTFTRVKKLFSELEMIEQPTKECSPGGLSVLGYDVYKSSDATVHFMPPLGKKLLIHSGWISDEAYVSENAFIIKGSRPSNKGMTKAVIFKSFFENIETSQQLQYEIGTFLQG